MFNAEKNIHYLEKQLAYFIYILGLDPKKLESLSIDQILEAARAFSRSDISSAVKLGYTEDYSKLDPGSPESVYIESQKIYIILNVRRLWYWIQLAKGLEKNA